MKKIKPILIISLCLFCIFTVLFITRKSYGSSTSDLPVRVAYLGKAYEAPLFIADKKQYFANSGIRVELIREDSESIRKELFAGTIDGITSDYSFLKYLDEGLDFKLVAGLHSGCVEAIASETSDIKYFKDLLGKTLGVEAMGNGPMTAFSSLVRKKGINPEKDIEWKIYPKKDLQKAVEGKQIDGALLWEGTELNDSLKVIYRASGGAAASHTHSSDQHFYDGFIALKGSLVNKDPKKAAILSKEWLKAAEWVGKNIFEASDIAVNGKYTTELSVNQCYDEIAIHMWMPGTKYAKENLKDYIIEQKGQRLFTTLKDENKFMKKFFADIIPDYRN